MGNEATSAVLPDLGVPRDLTFLFTDIEGSTRRWQAALGPMSVAQTRHDGILFAAADEFGGRVFSTAGDGMAVVFDAAPPAVAMAVAAQRRLQASEWPEGADIAVRMGIHTGLTYVRGDEFLGATLAKTARLMAAGNGHQLLVSSSTWALVEHRLPDGAAGRSRGLHRLRDIVGVDEIVEIVGEGMQPVERALRTEGRQTRLPPLRSSLIGRDLLLERVDQQLRDHPMVTLTGAGGVGKSSLALHTLHRVADRFSGGVHVLDASALEQGSLASAFAAAIDVRNETVVTLDDVVAALRGRAALVFIDNADTVFDEVVELADRLLDIEGPTLLSTSRQRLGVDGEVVVRVPALDAPLVSGVLGSTQLYLDRARDAGVDVPTDPASLAALDRMCEQLDHLPLAVELAAVHAEHVPPIAMVDELQRGLALAGGRGSGRRWSSIDAMVAWSAERLQPPERVVLTVLASCRAPVDLDTVHALAEPDGPRDVVAANLRSLVDHSLVVVEAQQGDVRYRLLETVRAWASRDAERSDTWVRAQRAHRDWHLAWCEASTPAERHLSGRRAVAAEQRMPDLVAALSYSASVGELDAVSRQARAMSGTWLTMSRGVEGGAWLAMSRDHVADAPGRLDHALAEASSAMAAQRWAVLAECMARVAALVAELPGHELTPLAAGLGALVAGRNGGLAQFDAAIELDRALGTAWAGTLQHMRADLLLFGGRFEDAIDGYGAALRHYGWRDDPWWSSSALSCSSVAHLAMGDVDVARAEAELGLELVGDLPHASGVRGRSIAALAGALAAGGSRSHAAIVLVDELAATADRPAADAVVGQPLVSAAITLAPSNPTAARRLLDLLQRLEYSRRTPWQHALWRVADGALPPSLSTGFLPPFASVREAAEAARGWLGEVAQA
ncbi:MAG: hypothetical protein RL238_527 [Actinomycetota bacterium]